MEKERFRCWLLGPVEMKDHDGNRLLICPIDRVGLRSLMALCLVVVALPPPPRRLFSLSTVVTKQMDPCDVTDADLLTFRTRRRRSS